MKHFSRPKPTVRALEAEAPWWAPVGLWQSWLGIAFLGLAAVLSSWG